MNRSLAKILCKRDHLHLTCSVTLNFNYSSPLVLAKEGNANDVWERQHRGGNSSGNLHPSTCTKDRVPNLMARSK